MKFCDLAKDLCRPCHKSQSPSGHGIGFGKTVDDDRPFKHARHLRNRYMRLSGVCQCAIDLIAQDKDIFFHTDLCDLFQILALHNGSGRIVRKGQDQDLGFLGDRGKEFFCGQTEFILFFQIDRDRHGACQQGTRNITYIAWFRDDHFIARITHCAQCHIDGFTSADRDQHFFSRIIGQVVFSQIIVGNLLS